MTAFVFAELSITDKEVYKREYIPRALEAVALFDGTFVSTGKRVARRIGAAAMSRTVLIAFPSFEVANAFYDSAPYRAASLIRDRCAITSSYLILDADGQQVQASS